MRYIHQQIRLAREARELTQSDLGNRIGQPQSSISRIERGGDLRLSTLLEITRVLELQPMLVPKLLVPAVQALIGGASGSEFSESSGATRNPLVGGEPEDAEDNTE
jgi:HTH-type transcriptional regulator / antitoxin HipB